MKYRRDDILKNARDRSDGVFELNMLIPYRCGIETRCDCMYMIAGNIGISMKCIFVFMKKNFNMILTNSGVVCSN
jgi:hypothetical protein